MDKNPLKIIILGSGNSGSGVVHDYLSGRPDVYTPLSQEMRLVPDPGGIIDLHAAVCFGFHINRANEALSRFRDFYKRCGRSKKGYRKGLKYESLIPGYQKKTERYIEKISCVTYKGMPFCERSKLSLWQAYQYEKKRIRMAKKGEKPLLGRMTLLTDEKNFLRETETYLNELLLFNYLPDRHNAVLIDQGGSFWSPDKSTQYYGNRRKIIVVTRDPRAVFSSNKTKGQAYPGEDVYEFCNWYSSVMRHINQDEWESENVMHVRYEDFVRDFKSEKPKLDRFLGLSPEIRSETDTGKSVKNIDKFKERLSQKEIAVIRTELEEYLQL